MESNIKFISNISELSSDRSDFYLLISLRLGGVYVLISPFNADVDGNDDDEKIF